MRFLSDRRRWIWTCAVALIVAFGAALVVRATRGPSLLERCRDRNSSRSAFQELLRMREAPDPGQVDALEEILDSYEGEWAIQPFAASQALHAIGTPDALRILDRYLLRPEFPAWMSANYAYHFDMPRDSRNSFLTRYHYVTLSTNLAVDLAVEEVDPANVKIPGRDGEGLRQGLRFTVTRRNVSDRPVRILADAPCVWSVLAFRDPDGTWRRSLSACSCCGDGTSRQDPYVTLAAGASSTYAIHVGVLQGSLASSERPAGFQAASDCFGYDVQAPGVYEVYAWEQAQPPPHGRRGDGSPLPWTGRVVSSPVRVTLR